MSRHRSRVASCSSAMLAASALACLLALAAPRAAHATNIILEWTAPGDDSIFGRASEYDMRYTIKANQFPTRFFSATRIPLAAPNEPGTVERVVLADMPEGSNIYFALRTRDKRGNWSRISNTLQTSAVTGVDGAVLRLDFSAPVPSPAKSTTRFTLTMPSPGKAAVEVIDVSGRRVRELSRGDLTAGEHELEWDLHDDGGNLSRAGVYFVRAQALGEQFLRRVVVLR